MTDIALVHSVIRTIARAGGVLVLFAALSGCTLGGSGKAGDEFDRLRRENRRLTDETAALRAERDELKAKLNEAARGGPLPLEVVDALPRCASIEIGRFSGFTPGGRAAPTGLVVYVEPLDGQRRFVPVAGELSITARLLPRAGEAGEGRELSRVTLTPRALREAYRSGMGGTHYTIEAPLTLDAGTPAGGTLVIQAELRDAVTGQTHRATRAVDLK
ncbi:MAG: hypothetical protein HUU18_12695 [Phycisphaerales bacterium]|nr:hypothetical protein [Phycisphaerales bacterium]